MSSKSSYSAFCTCDKTTQKLERLESVFSEWIILTFIASRSRGLKHLSILRWIHWSKWLDCLSFCLLKQLWLISVIFGQIWICAHTIRVLSLLLFWTSLNIRGWVTHLIVLQSQLYYLSNCGCLEEVLKWVAHHLSYELYSSNIELLLLLPDLLHKCEVDFKEYIGSHLNGLLKQAYFCSSLFGRQSMILNEHLRNNA